MSAKRECEFNRKWLVLLVPVGIGALFLLVWVIQLLWNGVLAVVFPAVPEIGYWQTWGLAILARLLFGRVFPHCTDSSRKPREAEDEDVRDPSPDEPQPAAGEIA